MKKSSVCGSAGHNLRKRAVLHQLTIRNFAIIDQLHIDWQPGLNVITGETGAGKSIIIDAVGALLGDRLGPEVVRSGANRALIEGVFGVVEPSEDLQAVLDEYGLEPEDGALIITRDLAGSGGRGGARVNGRSVPLAVLQELGELLVDVHGQSQHMALLRPREQLDYLDRFAGVLAERAALGALVRELRSIRDAHRRLVAEEREAARLQDVLQHELAEISRAELEAEEEEQLRALRSRLEHVERLRQAAETAHAALIGQDDDGPASAIDLLGHAVDSLGEGGRFDPALAAEAEALNGALAQAEESARTLRDYVDGLEADPAALERAEERLIRIAELKRKYGETVVDVLAFAEDARRRLDELEHRAERASELALRAQELLSSVTAAAQALSAQRQDAAARLAQAVEQELHDLQLGGRFAVCVTAAADEDGVPRDVVDFRIGASAEDEPRSMSRVASGGELARIALALKAVLARAEPRPTLIFDEIDMGVGGRTAPTVGAKLWRVATAGHQVLCVTHMPQVAAFADHHLVVSRSASGETRVSTPDAAARLDELAAMLGGAVTEAARHNATELLERAAATRLA